MPNSEILPAELLTLRISLPKYAMRLLQAYLDELDRWGRAMNLTSLEGAARIRHLVAEPLWVARQLSPTGRCLDIGSGNGSPGIPWHIGCGLTSTTLVETRQRRATFLHRMVKSLNLSEVKVGRGRFEDIASTLEPPDWVTLQGVHLGADLFEEIASISKQGTRLVWFTRKGVSAANPFTRLEIPNSGRSALIFRFA